MCSFYIYIYTCTDDSIYIYIYIYAKYHSCYSILLYNAFTNMSLWGLHPSMWRNRIEPCSSKLSRRRGILYWHTTDCIAIVKYKLDIVVHIFFIFGTLEECNLTYTFIPTILFTLPFEIFSTGHMAFTFVFSRFTHPFSVVYVLLLYSSLAPSAMWYSLIVDMQKYREDTHGNTRNTFKIRITGNLIQQIRR